MGIQLTKWTNMGVFSAEIKSGYNQPSGDMGRTKLLGVLLQHCNQQPLGDRITIHSGFGVNRGTENPIDPWNWM